MIRSSGKSLVVAMAAAALTLAACGGSDSPQSASAPRLASMLNLVHFDYDAAATTDALADRSVVVIEGRVVGLADGPIFGTAESGLRTAILDVDVDRVVQGALDGDAAHAYVLISRDYTTTPEQLQAAYPADAQNLLFLNKATFGADVTNPTAGYPAGATVYWPTTPQGLIMETPTGAEPLLIEEQAFADVPADSPLTAYVPEQS
jgi:hypothetical protein